MSRLLVVRHGQASAGAEDYDQLSERGYRQARHLGEQWAAEGFVPQSVYIGPRKRHLQSAETAAAAAAEPWPEPTFVDAWDEHQAYDVVMHSIPILAEGDPWVAERAERATHGGEGDALRAYFDLYKHVTGLWIREELPLEGTGFEPWSVFRARVEKALDSLVLAEGRGRKVAVFTSSGPVGVSAGTTLGLGDDGSLRLSWRVQNIAVTELLFDGKALSLHSFNSLPRLVDEKLRTLV